MQRLHVHYYFKFLKWVRKFSDFALKFPQFLAKFLRASPECHFQIPPFFPPLLISIGIFCFKTKQSILYKNHHSIRKRMNLSRCRIRFTRGSWTNCSTNREATRIVRREKNWSSSTCSAKYMNTTERNCRSTWTIVWVLGLFRYSSYLRMIKTLEDHIIIFG